MVVNLNWNGVVNLTVCSSITSNPKKAIELAQAFTVLIEDLEYANLHKRGYTYLKFTLSGSEAEWRFVDTVTTETTNTITEKKYTIA